ncbi:MAG: hypothetical protein AB1724_16045 [Thermodesulfobacteriota bacterium]
MFFKQIMMDDSGALSYVIGCPREKKACVVNPKKDIREYIDSAAAHDLRITAIFETPGHVRHKSGQEKLAELTGAPVYFLEGRERHHGKKARAGMVFHFGDAEVRIVNNPQYSPLCLSLLVVDRTNPDKPWLILTRKCLYTDSLFASENPVKEPTERAGDYFDYYEPEPFDGLTDNMASLTRGMFQTSRTQIAKMSLPI